MANSDFNTPKLTLVTSSVPSQKDLQGIGRQRILSPGQEDQLLVLTRVLISLADLAVLQPLPLPEHSSESLFKRLAFFQRNVLEMGAMAKVITKEIPLNF